MYPVRSFAAVALLFWTTPYFPPLTRADKRISPHRPYQPQATLRCHAPKPEADCYTLSLEMREKIL